MKHIHETGTLGLGGNENLGKDQVDSKKLFQFLINFRADQQGILPVKTYDTLHNDIKDKANTMSAKFQSVTTAPSPLS